MQATVATLLVHLLIIPQIEGERYVVENIFGDLPYLENHHGHRILQWAGGNRSDLDNDMNTCVAAGSRFECYVATRVTTSDNSYSDLQITVNCQLDSQTAFDFRRSQSCTCMAQVTPSDANKSPKTCPCTICPLGFGANPINIDCEQNEADPFVINTCTSLDCDFACNGTCRYDCSSSGYECPFCRPSVPTSSPVPASDTIDFPGCFADLITADQNKDGMIRKYEYLGFIKEYARNRRCISINNLSLQQSAIFNSLACICLEQEGAPRDCCLESNAHIKTAGANTTSRTEEQLQYLTTVCNLTDATITGQCPPVIKDEETTRPITLGPTTSPGSSFTEGPTAPRPSITPSTLPKEYPIDIPVFSMRTTSSPSMAPHTWEPPAPVGQQLDQNSTVESCVAVGTRFQCNIGTRVISEDDSYTDLQIAVNCQLEPEIGFDYRRAQSCACLVYAIQFDPTKPAKLCQCSVCPFGSGVSPISIDCTQSTGDPFVINTCSSLDCNFACNSTASKDNGSPTTLPSQLPTEPYSEGPSQSPSRMPSQMPSDSPSQEPEPTHTDQLLPAGRVCSTVTDPHIESFDGLSWDCQATGEFILSKSFDSEFEIQARFASVGTGGSVTTALVIREQGSPTIQVSLASHYDTVCLSEVYINGEEQQLGDGFDLGKVSMQVTLKRIIISYATGLEVTLLRHQSESFGCFYSTSIFLPSDYRTGERIVGLFGTPNGDPSDDWMRPDGSPIPIPSSSSGLLFEPAYDYCTTNWCIRDEANSMFTYKPSASSQDGDESFSKFFNCNAPFDPSIELSMANIPNELTDLCGTNMACLIDGLVGDVQDARTTLDDQAIIQETRDARAYTPAVIPTVAPSAASCYHFVLSQLLYSVIGFLFL